MGFLWLLIDTYRRGLSVCMCVCMCARACVLIRPSVCVVCVACHGYAYAVIYQAEWHRAQRRNVCLKLRSEQLQKRTSKRSIEITVMFIVTSLIMCLYSLALKGSDYRASKR